MTAPEKSWPRPSGPYAVGVAHFDITDPRRVTALAPTPLAGRRIDVHVWYPAQPTPDASRRRYMTPVECETLNFALALMTGVDPKALAYLNAIETWSFADAPPHPELKALPVIVFSHGGFSHALQNTALMETLASHGYLVVSVAHPYESGGVVYADGSAVTIAQSYVDEFVAFMSTLPIFGHMVESDPLRRIALCADLVNRFRGHFLYDLLAYWVEDILFVVDALRGGRWPEGQRGLAALADADRIGYCGMSYGGPVALRLSQLDPRTRAAVNLDGGFWTWDAFDKHAPTPFLFMGADPTTMSEMLALQGLDASPLSQPLSPATPNFADNALEPLHEAGLRADVVRVCLPGARHLSYTDMPLTHRPEHQVNTTLGPLAGGPEVEAINRFCLEFFDHWIKGRANGFPQAALKAFPFAVRRDLGALREAARRARGLS